MNHKIPDIEAGFRKGRGTRGQILNIHWIIEKAREFQKTSASASLTMLKVWFCGSQQTGEFFKRWEYQTTLPASWEICMQVKKQQLELYMEQQAGSKSGKKYLKVLYCHPTYLTYMQSTSCEMLGWVKQKLESSLLGKISSVTSDTQMTPPLWQKVKKN